VPQTISMPCSLLSLGQGPGAREVDAGPAREIMRSVHTELKRHEALAQLSHHDLDQRQSKHGSNLYGRVARLATLACFEERRRPLLSKSASVALCPSGESGESCSRKARRVMEDSVG
jgi:hypothetical protein